MITETITANDSAYLLDIGRQGEREARQIVFDLSWMAENFGDGTAALLHQRSQDGLPYQVDAVQDGNTLTWTVTDTDTAFVGYGKAEIRWTVGDVLAKTVIYKTRVAESITGDVTVPDPYQSWYDAMVETVGQEAEQKAEAVAREAAVDAVSGYVEQASASAESASESAQSAQASSESAARSAEALSGLSAVMTASGEGTVTLGVVLQEG